MNKNSRHFLYFILLNIATCCYYFYPILVALNSTLLAWGGDGIKNYFTYLYFVKYNHGTSFTGMNYPFGENIVFTDNTPALAWTLAKLKVWIPQLPDYSLGIMHSFMILSFFIGAIFVYKILRLFNLKGFWLIFSAIFITYFSPQFLRLAGHFSLSLVCCLPMIIYWIMKYQRTLSWKYPIYLYLTILFFTFCHVYFLAMGLVLIMAFSLSYVLTNKKALGKKVRYCLPLFISVLTALISFKCYLYLTDNITDRPKYPIGFLGAATTGEDILTTSYNFIGANVFSIFFGRSSEGSEGYTYLGFVSILVCLFLIFRIFKSIYFKKKKKTLLPTHPVRAYRTWLLTAFFCLVFAMGVPFLWGLDFLIEYFSTFRQFRSIGRFSWIFYYLMMIYAAIFLYRAYFFYKRKQYGVAWIKVIAILIVTIDLIEANGYVQHLHEIFKPGKDNYKNYFLTGKMTWNDYLKSIGHPSGNFQSVIGLPYFHVGSEKLSLQSVGEGYTLLYGSQLAVQTGLPLSNVMMSRTSWSQTYDQVALADGPFSHKTILGKYNKKPVLIVVNEYEQLLPGQSWMVEQATPIGAWAGFKLYELNIDTFLNRKIKYEDSLISIIKEEQTTFGLLEHKSGFFYNNHFDAKGANTNRFQTSGAFSPSSNERKELLDSIAIESNGIDTSYIFSAWLKCIDNSEFMPYILVEEYDKDNNKIYDIDFISACSTYRIENWFKAERAITIKPNTSYIKLYAMGGKKNLVSVDELLIRPLNTLYFYKISDTLLLINNRPVKIKL